MSYTPIAQLVILVIVVAFVVSPSHSWRARFIVAGIYLLSLAAPHVIPLPALAPFLVQTLLGLALLAWRRWERAAPLI